MSANGKEYELAIRISGIVDKNFNTSLVKANTMLTRFKASVATINSEFNTLDKDFNSVMKAGKNCFSTIATAAGVASVAVGAVVAASVAVGTEFESAFAGVKKTIDATEAEYERLRDDVLEMSERMPTSAADIAGVMEIAGQLGVANESLTDFTETMIMLGESTNLAAEDSATALSKFANITQMDNYGEDGISNYLRLGSVVTDLGNNFATTEEDIVNMATRMASAASLAGLTEAQIMGVAAAVSSVGIEAEAGGSTVSKLLKKIQLAVETNSGALEQYAEVAGVTAEQFAADFGEDATKALSAFISGLNDTERTGKSATVILDEMGLKEVRLSNTILALAGGENILAEALETANTAWTENTALTTEYGKRIETVDSKVSMIKNSVKKLGITIYDELRDNIVDTLGIAGDKLQELNQYVSGGNGVSKWIENLNAELPTMQRKIKSVWKEAEPFLEAFLNAGKWFLENLDVIAGAIAGIGSALATYKIASTLVHIVNALMGFLSMNPVTLAIMGVVGAVGLLTGAAVAWKTKQKTMVDDSLAEHFGNIALSMKEIQAVAEYIVSSESLGGVKEALEAFEELDEISSVMENAVSELNKMNWKVSIGMELTEDEQEEYKSVIDEYVEAAQEYAGQAQYAVSLNLAASSVDSDIAAKVNSFYAEAYSEMVSLGEELSATVNEAFSDKILDPDEIVAISELQAKMAELQESLAVGEFEAQLSVIGMEFSGSELTADSFKDLQAAISEQVEKLSQAYKDSYAKNYASVQAAYDAGDYLNDEEYYSALRELENEYLSNIQALQGQSIDFQINTIMDVYGEDINSVFEKYKNLSGESLYDAIMGDEDFEAARGGLYELLELLEPMVEQMSGLAAQFEESGNEIPDSIKGMIEKFSILSSLAGSDVTDIFTTDNLPGKEKVARNYYTGLDIANDYFNKYGDIFGGVTSSLVDSMAETATNALNDSTESAIRPAVEGMYAWSQETIDEYYSQGFDVEADVNISLNPIISGFNKKIRDTVGNHVNQDEVEFKNYSVLERYNLPTIDFSEINQRADGGLATKPELTWFAEKGPEMAIPIDGSQNAISLWEQTGRLLGMESRLDNLNLDDSGSSTTIEYNPTLQFYGEAPSKDDIEEALRVSQDEFDSLMERYIKTHGRVSFG